MDALGLELLGPQYPLGRRSDPTPKNLPTDTRNVPTYHTTRRSPETATKQLDWAFASRGFHRSISVSALNSVEDWVQATTAGYSSKSQTNSTHRQQGSAADLG